MKQEPEFEIGTIVKLRSGGPIMTVKDYTDYVTYITYVCVWFTDGILREAFFVDKTLAKW